MVKSDNLPMPALYRMERKKKKKSRRKNWATAFHSAIEDVALRRNEEVRKRLWNDKNEI